MKISVISFGIITLFTLQGMCQDDFQEISKGNSMLTGNQSGYGIAVSDYDNDGDDDFIILNDDPNEHVKLFRNDGNFIFSEVSEEAGISALGQARTAVWFDADNNGWLDLYIVGNKVSLFFENQQDGTFIEKSAFSGLSTPTNTISVVVGDLNNDNWLDIYCANQFQQNELYLNHGELKFYNHISGSGAEIENLQSMGTVLFDYEQDGDLDIYCTYDINQPNKFFINDGTGKFKNQANELNLDYAGFGMGADFADFNHDSKYDLYLSYYLDNPYMLQQADGTFINQNKEAGLTEGGMSWGVSCTDINNDTFTDIILSNGVGITKENRLFLNNANGTFEEKLADLDWSKEGNTLACAYSDLNNDGLQDMIFVNKEDPGIQIIKNQLPQAGHWIQLTLVGVNSNKFGIGARIELEVEGTTLIDEVTAGSGFATQNTSRIHFGLGASQQVDLLKIIWPNGHIDEYTNLAADQRWLAVESKSINAFTTAIYQTALESKSTIVLPQLEVPSTAITSGNSIARIWNEVLMEAIRNDLARPTIHARNLFHFSIAAYDGWAIYSSSSTPYFLGQTIGEFTCPLNEITQPKQTQLAQEETMSYAIYRLISHRFQTSPNASISLDSFSKIMTTLGYDPAFESTDYQHDGPAALGNYLAEQLIAFGLQDGSNESNLYENQYYSPINEPFWPLNSGNPTLTDPNHWQPLSFDSFVDQSGNEIGGGTPGFLSAEWGNVTPFALTEDHAKTLSRGGNEYKVYHDPGHPPYLQTNEEAQTEFYGWNFALVAQWSSQMGPENDITIDISPAAQGNLKSYPENQSEYKDFYLATGGDPGQGYDKNPYTGLPYESQLVKQGDYARVLAEFWADGPDSETPPGHWFTILNYVSDHPLTIKKFEGKGIEINELEWDVKSYFLMGSAMHDAAITAWSLKGYYDYIRPVSSIRYMAQNGQSTSADLPSYNPLGIPLIDGYIELIQSNDPLVGDNSEHLNKVKIKAWKGPGYIENPDIDLAGVGWILGADWSPYQRASFVTPPFAGYVSGHSTFSRAAAIIMSRLTGSEYFPGGMSSFEAPKNEFLVFEEGPSSDIILQWAKYKDAADQCSLSRIWGGIHPPIDDIPGRIIGSTIGEEAFELAKTYFEKVTLNTAETPNSPATFALFPNPVTNGILNFKANNMKLDSNCTIMNLTGQMILSPNLTPGELIQSIDVSGIQSGIYVIILDNMTKKFIVK